MTPAEMTPVPTPRGWLAAAAVAIACGRLAAAEPAAAPELAADSAAIVMREYVAGELPTPSCHASTIVEAAPGELVVAWFGGTAEGKPDVGIWVSRRTGGRWSPPAEVADGGAAEPQGQAGAACREPCWNPVLFRNPAGELMLFSKVGPNPADWRGRVQVSRDGGRSWSRPEPIAAAADAPEAIRGGPVGPIKNKPLRLADGSILSPSSTEYQGWRAHFERSTDGGATWTVIGPVHDGTKVAAIQPSILDLGEGRLLAIGRTGASKRLFAVASADAGRSWGEPDLLDVPNPNSGTDAVTLADGRHLLVYNHSETARSPLAVAVSRDGRGWTPAVMLETEPGEFSYPAVIQAADGRVHVTYTWNRKRIAHVVLDPERLPAGP